MNTLLVTCPACQKEVSCQARHCPPCGHTLPADSEYRAKFGLYWAIPFTILGSISLLMNGFALLSASSSPTVSSATADASIGLIMAFMGLGLSLIGWIPYFKHRNRN